MTAAKMTRVHKNTTEIHKLFVVLVTVCLEKKQNEVPSEEMSPPKKKCHTSNSFVVPNPVWKKRMHSIQMHSVIVTNVRCLNLKNQFQNQNPHEIFEHLF